MSDLGTAAGVRGSMGGAIDINGSSLGGGGLLGGRSQVFWNETASVLCERAVQRGEVVLSRTGGLICRSGERTGRSPGDKYIVRDASTDDQVWWDGPNQPLEAAAFERLYAAMHTYLDGRDLFVQDRLAGADPAHELPIRVVTETAWHALFARHMFRPAVRVAAGEPRCTIIHAPGFRASPALHGTKSDACIALDVTRGIVLIGGTGYAGEIKKAVFTLLNYLLPARGVLPMHCAANIGADGQVAVLFGLSGTGKTTLSSDPLRRLIGDDEHGWCEEGVFNFEGGCYAKTIRLCAEAEPGIFAAIHRFASVLENVSVHPRTRELDLDDATLTENGRAAYPLSAIPGTEPSGCGAHPRDVVMLTADAYGVLPPIARLSTAAALYHFLSGYTARAAGTEATIKEPVATFSACFGAPFLPRPPHTYAEQLGQRLARHGSRVWLVNTGWTGGPYGTGARMDLKQTRALLAAALSGALDGVEYRTDRTFGLDVPVACPNVPARILSPRETWADPTAYDAQARRVAAMFVENFRTFEGAVPAAVTAAGPQ